ncbi:MAG TPA: glycosyltransferase [Streptosporangiaceae bacterium]|nr:glycosyltransferase [Streptosporangiaceae bacterium]
MNDADGAVPGDVTVVIATRNRRRELCRTLARLAELPERPPVVVVDNDSGDGTAAMVHARFPAVTMVELPRNLGAAARNQGVRQARTPYVALSDDDSWWAPGALGRAAGLLAAHPRLGVIAARMLVEPGGEPDPINGVLAASPLPRDGLPGPRVLGFLACGAVVRRSAFLGVGGFASLLFIGGEEELLAYDLAASGWAAVYVPEVVAHHQPSAIRDTGQRRMFEARNHALIAWLRRPPGTALRLTAGLARRARREPAAVHALAGLLRCAPRAVIGRRRLPADVEAGIRLLEAGHAR